MFGRVFIALTLTLACASARADHESDLDRCRAYMNLLKTPRRLSSEQRAFLLTLKNVDFIKVIQSHLGRTRPIHRDLSMLASALDLFVALPPGGRPQLVANLFFGRTIHLDLPMAGVFGRLANQTEYHLDDVTDLMTWFESFLVNERLLDVETPPTDKHLELRGFLRHLEAHWRTADFGEPGTPVLTPEQIESLARRQIALPESLQSRVVNLRIQSTIDGFDVTYSSPQGHAAVRVYLDPEGHSRLPPTYYMRPKTTGEAITGEEVAVAPEPPPEIPDRLENKIDSILGDDQWDPRLIDALLAQLDIVSQLPYRRDPTLALGILTGTRIDTRVDTDAHFGVLQNYIGGRLGKLATLSEWFDHSLDPQRKRPTRGEVSDWRARIRRDLLRAKVRVQKLRPLDEAAIAEEKPNPNTALVRFARKQIAFERLALALRAVRRELKEKDAQFSLSTRRDPAANTYAVAVEPSPSGHGMVMRFENPDVDAVKFRLRILRTPTIKRYAISTVAEVLVTMDQDSSPIARTEYFWKITRNGAEPILYPMESTPVSLMLESIEKAEKKIESKK